MGTGCLWALTFSGKMLWVPRQRSEGGGIMNEIVNPSNAEASTSVLRKRTQRFSKSI